MEAIAHSPAFAKKAGVPQSVGKDFSAADKGKKFKGGGMAKSDMKEDTNMDMAQDKAMIKKAMKQHDMQEHKGGKGTKLALKKGGMMKKMAEGGKTSSKDKTKEEEQFDDRINKSIKKDQDSKIFAKMGREDAEQRQRNYTDSGGPIGTPAAYVRRGADYVSDKLTDLDAYLSEKAGMTDRANMNKSYREGMKNNGSFNKKGGAIKAKCMASGGKVSQLSKANGIAVRGKSRGRIV